jgi:hypothetical protein
VWRIRDGNDVEEGEGRGRERLIRGEMRLEQNTVQTKP